MSLVCGWADCEKALIPPVGRGRPPKWCDLHKRKAYRRNASADSRSTFCLEPGCSRPLRAKGKCKRHYDAMLRAEGRFAPQEWTEARQENRERRRARMKGVYVGSQGSEIQDR